MINGYRTVKDMSEKWGITQRAIQSMCAEGRIPGVVKFGRAWAIPVGVEKPIDGRIISGDYINWRKCKKLGNE